ncbi:MAG: GNAT family N-acetyltransferase [Planctomycetota bacterium]|nr:GNAT family N-acetyltransferase [Planctomycetota bacterium]
MSGLHQDPKDVQERTFDGYTIRPYQSGDEASLLETFNLVFSEGNPDYVPRTLDEWRWAFLENPAGTRIMVAVKDGQVVAQNACLPVRVWIGGEERLFGQGVDSFCHPGHRAGLRRPGLWVKTVWEFIDEYGAADRDLLHYGWPIWSAWRIGKTFLKYEVVRTQNLLVRSLAEEPARDAAALDAHLAELGIERFDVGAGGDPAAGFDEQARWLWDRLAGEWGVSAIRDDAFLNWRLSTHPRHRYTVLASRNEDGILWGYAVYRHGDWIEKDMGLLVDWLSPPPSHPDAGHSERLHAALLAFAASEPGGSAASVTGVFPDWAPEFTRFQERGWRVHPSEYFMIGRHYHKRYDMLWLQKHWWYTLADTDLV